MPIRLVSLISLLVLLVELLDPTTPFIRLSSESSSTFGSSYLTKIRYSSTVVFSAAVSPDEDNESSDESKTPIEQLEQPDYHSAVHADYYSLPSYTCFSIWSIKPTNLHEQHLPPTRKRPPIV